jgi:histidyl-tRNA synthetase
LFIKDLAVLKTLFKDSPTGLKGIEELETFHSYLDLQATTNEVEFDITLARGLSYYTGCIFEVAAKGIKMGSIGGGGRYDDLTGIFGLKDVSGVGISFGADRIYDVLEELDLFPKDTSSNLSVLFVAMDDAAHKFAFGCVNQVRNAGINADIYPEPAKMQKQMKFANARNVNFVAIIGEAELAQQSVMLKNMITGEQTQMNIETLIETLKG